MVKDHTKSLLPYQTILEASEEEYRSTPLSDRDVVITGIMENIIEAARSEGAEVAGEDILYKVCTLPFPPPV